MLLSIGCIIDTGSVHTHNSTAYQALTVVVYTFVFTSVCTKLFCNSRTPTNLIRIVLEVPFVYNSEPIRLPTMLLLLVQTHCLPSLD